jgi:hypothetical protein
VLSGALWDLRALKEFARTLRPSSPLRLLLLEQPDFLSAETLRERVTDWLTLAALEGAEESFTRASRNRERLAIERAAWAAEDGTNVSGRR